MITMHYYAPVKGIVGKETEQIDAATVKDALSYVKTAYGKAAYKAVCASLIVVNDVSIGLYQDKKTPLHDGDVVGFLPLCGGG